MHGYQRRRSEENSSQMSSSNLEGSNLGSRFLPLAPVLLPLAALLAPPSLATASPPPLLPTVRSSCPPVLSSGHENLEGMLESPACAPALVSVTTYLDSSATTPAWLVSWLFTWLGAWLGGESASALPAPFCCVCSTSFPSLPAAWTNTEAGVEWRGEDGGDGEEEVEELIPGGACSP
jgi:hypothetical protein